MARLDSWQPIADLLGHLATIAANFVDREIEGARLAAQEDLVDIKRAAGRYALAATLALGATALLLTALVAFLAALLVLLGLPSNLAVAAAALVVALLLVLVAWLLYRNGNDIMRVVAQRIETAMGVFAPAPTRHQQARSLPGEIEDDG